MSKKSMTQKDVSRIHSAEAKKSGGNVSSDGFTARATRTVSKKGGK